MYEQKWMCITYFAFQAVVLPEDFLSLVRNVMHLNLILFSYHHAQHLVYAVANYYGFLFLLKLEYQTYSKGRHK